MGQWTVIAFVYWILFMGALAPGNITEGLAAGVPPNWSREIVRLAGAGLLGASVTPLLLALAHRFPPAGPGRWRNVAVQALAVVGLALLLVLVSCFLAAWVFAGRLAPTWADVASQLMANAVLLVFCLSLLLAVIQVLSWAISARGAVRAGWTDRLTIGERGHLRVVDLKTVEWIESQGNYQALHTHDAVHLFRGTSKGLSAKLDPARFVRIHRRFVVAADQVSEVEPLPNGDAIVRLASGVELRQSRHHRGAFRAFLLGAEEGGRSTERARLQPASSRPPSP